MIVRLAIRLVVLAAIIGVVTRIVPVVNAAQLAISAAFSWLAELLLPVFHRGKHAHPARAVHDSA